MAMIPLVIFVFTGIIWVYTAYLGDTLYNMFVDKNQDVVDRVFPQNRYVYRHPEKFMILIRRSMRSYFDSDMETKRMRKRFIVMLWIAVFAPFIGIILGFIVASLVV